ncbi:MAG TPA: hypothetical protein VHN74_10490 [Candidatus Angelobacter sp.]|jgi:hypothetical protein|nr:hypothetical protein [Candidatus Angelobacter sp.]
MALKQKAAILGAACLVLLLSAVPGHAAEKEHGTVIGDADIYVAPDFKAQRVGRATRGRDIFLIERSKIDNKDWAHVLATIQEGLLQPREISGWVDGRLVVTVSTPNADQIIYGEAVDSEHQQELRGGRQKADQDAMRLYYRLYEYFPGSPLAAESLWRAADLRWQLEKSGVFSRPSAREMDANSRSQIDDETMRELIKKFPGTRWAQLGAYDLLDNKICGDWKGEAKCPEKESDMYEHYAHEYPQSPKAPEALYNAAWRQAVLVDMYAKERGKADKARKKSLDIIQELTTKYTESDWRARGVQLRYLLEQNLPVYGQ